MKKNKLLTKSTNFFVKLLGICLLFFAVISIVQGFYGLRVGFREGRFGFGPGVAEDGKSIKVNSLIKNSPAERAGLKAGDRILSVNGRTVTGQDRNVFRRDAVAGSSMVMKVQRGDREVEITMTRKLLPIMDRILRILNSLILPALMMTYILVGLWGLFKEPSYITKLIALVCFFFGSMTCVVGLPMVFSPLTKIYYYQIRELIGGFSLLFAPASWLFLFVNFPKKTTFYKKHGFSTIFFIFLFPLGYLVFSFVRPVDSQQFEYTLHLSALYMLVYIYSGILILYRGLRKEKNVLKKRQYKLIHFGIKYGALSMFLGFFILIVYSLYLQNLSMYFGWFAFILFLMSQGVGLILPFTFLNSFFQKKILETESALKRRLRYIGSTFALFCIYLTAAFFVANWIVSEYELTDPSLIVLMVLVLALTFSPLHARVLRWVEQKLYPEKTKYKKSLQELIKKMSSFIESSQVLDDLSKWLTDTMKLSPVAVFSLDRVGQANMPLKPGSGKSVLAKVTDGSNFYWDEVPEENGSLIEEDEKTWALEKGISITVPLISRDEMVGLLNIGKKKNREDFTGDDLEIFREAAYHTAQMIRNIKLQEEHLEKKRLDKELEVARSIQENLMPRTVPDVEGLDLACKYMPCFEVGGDYFDIIPVNKNKTVLVIGDVSGKGTGAALMMSNLQASLKTAISVFMPLADIVFLINNMICENSLPSQFITFFLSIWDSRSQTLEYINAGHNAPLLIRATGKIEKLPPTGIGLGIQEDQTYKSKEVPLGVDDIVIIYTDGIEEFFNPELEAFGVGRMISTFVENRGLHPAGLVEMLFKKLEEFSPGTALQDDLAIIAAKRTK